MKNFFYYFVAPRPPESEYDILALVFIILLFAGGIAFSIMYKKRKKNDPVFKRMFRLTASRIYLFTFLFLVLLALRYEGIPYFSMRLWVYITLGFFAYFVYDTVKTYHVDYKKEQANMAIRAESAKDQPVRRYVAAKK